MRLHTLDIIRGAFILWMIPVQILDALHIFPYNYWLWDWFSGWLYGFWTVAGWSCVLMSRKYKGKAFIKKVVRRFLELTLVGVLLAWTVPFPIRCVWWQEAVACIGFNLLFFALLVYVNKLWIYLLGIPTFALLYHFLPFNVMFEPFAVQCCFCVGASLSYLHIKDVKNGLVEWVGRNSLWLYVAHYLVIAGIYRFI